MSFDRLLSVQAPGAYRIAGETSIEQGGLGWGRVLNVERSAFLFPYIPHVGSILEQAYAAIPAKDGVVVSCRADLFCLCEGAQRLFEERQQDMRRLSGAKLRLRAPFVHDSRVVEPLVGVAELLEGLFRFAVAIGAGRR